MSLDTHKLVPLKDEPVDGGMDTGAANFYLGTCPLPEGTVCTIFLFLRVNQT